ncbi:MAG TPA: thioredoxin-dependent thiol peroxidase [Candidatus Krumholzibacteria bacterium]|nr:thioredoxin-dependent thiol peroxidase [Candidatus Krumholzibacteria bacterium]HPD71777.1 thioredoxin-dependent thiol peroxidase [Candidatus Krumholzibacteria bacterium]HRY41290.1 thioredoxin-dependent thiol peroxidase [Candidatus Krumholzibacteria bacterium]
MLQIGKTAPAFSLKNQDGATVKLAQFRGRTVVLFAYPKAATSGCTRQACGFRDNWSQVAAAGAVVLGLSPDPPATLRRWRAKQGFPFDLLSDPDHEVLARYGAWGEKTMYGKKYEGVIRSHFVIDGAGKVADVQIKVSPEDSVARAMAFLRGGDVA